MIKTVATIERSCLIDYSQIRTNTGIPNYSQLKKYYQLIEDLQSHGCIGVIDESSDDFEVLGVSTSNVRPTATGTWFLLHFLSVQECLSTDFLTYSV